MKKRSASRWSAARVAFAASAVATLAVIAACSEGSIAKSVTGPAAPSSVSYDGIGIASAGLATVCVGGPNGVYTLQNSNYIEGIGTGTTLRYDDGSTGHPTAGATYQVTVSGGVPTCIPELTRLTGQNVDDFSQIQVSLISGPALTQWDHTVCQDDVGDAATNPCNVSNPLIHMNIHHGTTVTIYSSALANPQFVVGDLASGLSQAQASLKGNSNTTNTLNFWGSQWWKNNPMSQFHDNGWPSFKGYAMTAGTCGGTWTSRVGNSPPPPATISEFVDVIVTSNVWKDGPDIRGNIKQIVRVHQDGGYGPNPGHDGNGPVTEVLCTAGPNQ